MNSPAVPDTSAVPMVAIATGPAGRRGSRPPIRINRRYPE